MTVEQYYCELEVLAEDAGLELKPSFLTKLSKRARELESDSDFTEEDINDELLECLSAKQQESEDILELVSCFCDFVVAEQENCDILDSSEEDSE